MTVSCAMNLAKIYTRISIPKLIAGETQQISSILVEESLKKKVEDIRLFFLSDHSDHMETD